MPKGKGPDMMSSYDTLLISRPANHVVQVTLNRPDFANAFNTQMALDLVDIFESLSMDPSETRAIILTGSGTRAFCAGGDLKERHGMSNAAWSKQHLIYERMARAVITCPIPVIGAINGAAYGGGCELAAAVDFAYVARGARFAQTEVKIGIIPGAGGTQTLARAIGERRAKELILTGEVFTAEQALNWGLANAILPQFLYIRVRPELGNELFKPLTGLILQVFYDVIEPTKCRIRGWIHAMHTHRVRLDLMSPSSLIFLFAFANPRAF